MKAVNAGLVTFYYWTARSYYFYTLSATPSAGDVLYDSPNIQDDSGERVTSYNEGELYITHFTWAFTHDSSGDVGKGKIKAVYVPSKTYRQWHTEGKSYNCYTLNGTPNVGDVVYEYNSSTDTMTPTDTVKGYYPNMQMYGWGSGGQLYTPTQNPQVGDYAFIRPEIIYDLNRESFTIIDVGDNYITIDDVTPLTEQRNTSYDRASLYDYILINNNNFYFKYSNQKTTKPKYKLINQ